MARRAYDDTAIGPAPELAADCVLKLAQQALDRMAGRVCEAPVSDAFIESFCRLLMSGDKLGAERMLRAATQRRAGYAGVADGLLSASARRMGEKWQTDEASFLEVTIAVSMIFRLNHEHAQRHVPIVRDPSLRQAVFATMPGQAHNLGLVLAAEAFRQDGWQVTLLLDAAMNLILDRVRRLRPDVVGLSVSNLDRRYQLEQLIGELRALPTGVEVLLGGSAAEDVRTSLPPAPGLRVVHDIRSTLRVLRAETPRTL